MKAAKAIADRDDVLGVKYVKSKASGRCFATDVKTRFWFGISCLASYLTNTHRYGCTCYAYLSTKYVTGTQRSGKWRL